MIKLSGYIEGQQVNFIKRWLRFDPTNKRGVVIKANTYIKKPNGDVKCYKTDTKIDLTSQVTTGGKDYFLFLNNDETISAVTNKATGTGTYFGRFHTLCANAGSINMIAPASPSSGLKANDKYLVKSYSQDIDPDFYAFYNKNVVSVTAGTPYDVVTLQHPLSGFTAGDILPESIFCDSWQPKTRHEDAMVYDQDTGVFIDVYLQSGTGLNTKSAYNATHTVSRQPANHMRDMVQVGKKLLSDHEFASAALGSNECTVIQGAADKTTVGGHVDTASRRMISAIGCEECCGYLWQWGRDFTGWTTTSWGIRDGKGSFGYEYGDAYTFALGGSWANSTHCGSGCRNTAVERSTVVTDFGGRGSAVFAY